MMNLLDLKNISMFLDEEGRVKQLPAKTNKRKTVLEYLSTKFAVDREYTEKEVNEIINTWHTFQDYFILWRELIDFQFLHRTPNGSKYWKEEMNSEISE